MKRKNLPESWKSCGDTNYSWYARNGPKGLEKETGGIGDQKKNQDHPDHSTNKIGGNI